MREFFIISTFDGQYVALRYFPGALLSRISRSNRNMKEELFSKCAK
jgi:hypothetical protein